MRISELEEENTHYRAVHGEYLRILEASETISRIIIESNDLDTMLGLVLEEFLNIFSCDRAWLLYHCDPSVTTYRIPMECTRPQWPGAEADGIDIPTDDFARQVFSLAIDSQDIVRIDQEENSHFLNEDVFERFHIHAQIFMAIKPRMGKPWLLGIHHCEAYSTYSRNECDLFKTLGNRISDGLSNLIAWQNTNQLFENTEISIWNEDMSEVYSTLEHLRQDGVKDLRRFLLANEHVVWNMVAMIKVVQVNKSTLTLFEADNGPEFIKSIGNSFGPNSIGVFIDELCAIWNKDKVFRTEVTFQTLSGKEINAIISFQIPETVDGYKSIPVSIIDISERKKLEKSLQKSEERLELAVSGSSDIFWDWVDLQKDEIWWSPRLRELLDYQDQKFIPNSRTFIQIVHPEDRLQVQAALQAHYNNRVPFDEEYRVRTSSGGEKWVRGRGRALWDANGRPLRMSGSLQDITERKHSESELRLAMETADLANRAKSEFLAVMSHEIRTPLNAILGMSEVARELTMDAEQLRYLEIINRSGKNLLTLIEDILDLSYIESGRLVLEKGQVNLRELTQEAMDIHLHNANNRGVAMLCRIASEIPESIEGDQKRLRQVLLNLLGNAIKFTTKGKVELRVALHSHDRVLFSVLDSGIGIPEDKQTLIFSPFSQADSSSTRKHGGVGLGLAICKRLLDSMGGEIWVESQVGKGSTFNFVIPLAVDDQQLTPTPVAANSVTGGEVNTVDVHSILLAEDNMDNAMVIDAYLMNSNHQVEIVRNGKQALVNIQSKKRYDLVLMDIQMPIMDGLEATRQIRAWEKNQGSSRIPILAMTAHAMSGDAEKSLAAGCDSHITKPITREELLGAIDMFAQHDRGIIKHDRGL